MIRTHLRVVSVVSLSIAFGALAPAQQAGTSGSDPQKAQDVESPVSNPETGKAPAVDSSSFLFGDWGDWRHDMAAKGFTFDLQWTQHGQKVTEGGVNKDFEYGGTLDYLFEFDLERLGMMRTPTAMTRNSASRALQIHTDTTS